MPDISMCTGEKCKQRNVCFRYKAKANPDWQSYFVKPPLINDEECEFFILWENKNE